MHTKITVDKEMLRNSDTLKGFWPAVEGVSFGNNEDLPFTSGCILCHFYNASSLSKNKTRGEAYRLYYTNIKENGEPERVDLVARKVLGDPLMKLLHRYERTLNEKDSSKDREASVEWKENFINNLIAELEENDLVEWEPVKETRALLQL